MSETDDTIEPSEIAKAIKRMRPGALRWLVANLSPSSSLHTSHDYPRQLEALGIILRRPESMGSLMLHSHVLEPTKLGAAVLDELAARAAAALSDEQAHDLLQEPPGPSVRKAPLAYEEHSGRWRLASFGRAVRRLVHERCASRWPRPTVVEQERGATTDSRKRVRIEIKVRHG